LVNAVTESKLLFVNEPINDILVNELQLGEQLNHCVHENRRSHFSLMLAMLTDDVRDHAQFKLPHTEVTPPKTDEDALRKLLHVNDGQPLALNSIEDIPKYNQAELIENNKLTELRLRNAITPNPLSFRDDVKHINMNVVSNTSIHCQKRLQQKLNEDKPNTRLNFKANEWLNVINKSMLNSDVSLSV